MSRLVETLKSGRILLMDGAMGTELQRAGIGDGECYEAWNLSHPDRVRGIHQAYADAGAEVLLTNTFQANPLALARHGLQDLLQDIIATGVQIARSAARADRFVVAAFGPTSGLTGSQLGGMIQAVRGADAILIETVSDAAWVEALSPQASWKPLRLPLFVSYTFSAHPDGPTGDMDRMVHAAVDLGAAALGINCGREVDMDFSANVIRCYRGRTGLPLFARPNAGTPTRHDERWAYPWTPLAMSARLPALLDAGASMVGGCCGTTPAHIAAFRPMIEQANAEKLSKLDGALSENETLGVPHCQGKIIESP